MQTPDEAALEHSIIGTNHGTQGAGQVVPQDVVLCVKCGWMRCSDYVLHVADIIRERDVEVRDQIRAEEVDPLAVLLAATREGLARSASRAKGVTQVREMLAEHAGHIYAVAEAAHYRRGRTKPREDRGKAASEALSRP